MLQTGRGGFTSRNGIDPSPVRADRTLFSQAPRHAEIWPFGGSQCDPLHCREWREVAQAANLSGALAHDLHPHAGLDKEWSAGAGLRGTPARTDDPLQNRGGIARQHLHQGASRRHRRIKKNGPQAIGRSRGGLTTKIHLVAGDERTALCFSLSAGQCADGPEGRKLLSGWKRRPATLRAIIMDRAYEGDETRQLIFDLELEPVVPPKVNRLNPWEYDRELYKRRNEVERLFRRLKGFRRIFSRFEKLDVMFTAFIHIALIFDALFYLNTP